MKIDSTLTCNLQELYGLEVAEGSSYHQVVPGLWGNRIYYSEVGWGKILKIIYKVWTFIFGSKHVLDRLQKAIEYTEKAFLMQLEPLQEHFSKYKESLILLLEEDCDFDPKTYAKERWIFTKWHDSVVPFIKRIKEGKCKKIDSLFKRVVGKIAGGDSSVFKFPSNYPEIQNYQRIIDVVRQIPTKAPLPVLKKLSWKKKLLEEEEKALKTWIDSIHSLGDQMKVLTFHRGMHALVKHVYFIHRSKHIRPPRTEDLELGLAKYGLNIFRQKDSKHMKWCDSLEAGQVLEIKGRMFPLDREIPSPSMDNQLRVFTVQNNPNKVILVGRNRVILSIKRVGAQEYSWGIRCMGWSDVSPCGRFAVVERLRTRLHKRQWKSGRKIHVDDILLLKPIVDQVAWFIEQNGTPRNFDCSHLMYDQTRSLKSTKTLVKGEFNYPKLVDFCVGCANRNLAVYKFLVEESGLFKHSYQNYYREVVKRTLDGTDDKAEDISGFIDFKISDCHVINRGKELQKQVIELQSKCMKALMSEYAISNSIEVAEVVSKQIYQEYQQRKYICSLWPKMKKRIVTLTAKQLNLSESYSFEDLI